MNTNIKELIESYKQQAKELNEYTSIKNSFRNKNFSPKKSVQMGKKLTSLVERLVRNNIEDLIELLNDKDIVIAETTAEYLYPLYPHKCIKIMKIYLGELTESLDKLKVETKIEGYTENQIFFVNEFKKLYNVDDLTTLNREK